MLRLGALVSLLVSASPLTPEPEPADPPDTTRDTPRMIPVGDFLSANIEPAMELFVERVNAGDRVVYFKIDSFGGEVFLGLDFMKLVDEARAQGVATVCVVDTKAMSMAAVFLEGSCDVRLMTPRALILFHNAATGARGNVRDLDEASEMLAAINESLATVCALKLNISPVEFRKRIHEHSWVLAAEEAIMVGAVDGLVDPLDLPPVYALE